MPHEDHAQQSMSVEAPRHTTHAAMQSATHTARMCTRARPIAARVQSESSRGVTWVARLEIPRISVLRCLEPHDPRHPRNLLAVCQLGRRKVALVELAQLRLRLEMEEKLASERGERRLAGGERCRVSRCRAANNGEKVRPRSTPRLH
eukprot:CAMPEP_0196699126 /NCGR_PEP_ID=MMETSP1090-20130531/46263_1 /TAXON_ID=37098 /ORGANISM="Isochrysis sp, Strain CCMP1244" /LENGTH=147 /DNA_ID=CAMNT_0042038803 /DNA_START=61 /DNA_END=501 /DNA_ORIENTATION=-